LAVTVDESRTGSPPTLGDESAKDLWLAQTITAVAGRAPYRCLYPVAVESSVDASATKLASRSATERGRVRVGSAARSLSWHTA